MQESSPNKENIANALRNSFGHGRVLVVGDIMLDRYLWGTVDRISPEAPTPILRQRRESSRAGGAGNVALNLAGLGLDVAIAGFVGNDENRDRLLKIFAGRGIDTSAIVTLSDRPTGTKTRVIAGHKHVLRLDSEDLSDIDIRDRESLSKAVIASLEVDAIVMSDHAKGALSLSLCRQIISAARQTLTPVLVKPKGADFSKYSGVSVLTPNLLELSQACSISVNNIDDLVRAAKVYVDDARLQFMVLTRGANGTTLIAEDQTIHSSAKAREVFDVSGAGDTVIATVAAAMLAELDYVDMLHIVNLAAGVVVGRVGTVAIDQKSLLRALHADGQAPSGAVHSLDELLLLIDEWRDRKRSIVFAQGCFDGVHAGHVSYLQNAAHKGDKLIVGISSDRATCAAEGDRSPINSQNDRATVVAALAPVDAVILCDDETPLKLIKALKPDVFVKGADNSESLVIGAAEVESYGGRVEFLSPAEDNIVSEHERSISD